MGVGPCPQIKDCSNVSYSVEAKLSRHSYERGKSSNNKLDVWQIMYYQSKMVFAS